MNIDTLIERSPMQFLSTDLNGGLKAGQVGGVLARAGVGKSAILVHIALNTLLRRANVLHISLIDSQAHVRSFYDEIYNELLRSSNEAENPYTRLALEKHRMVHSSLGRSFELTDLEKLLDSFASLLDFHPSLVIIDGLEHDQIEISSLASIATARNLRIWTAVRTHRGKGPAATDLAEQFTAAVELRPENKFVEMHLIQNNSQEVTNYQPLLLVPVSMLVHQEETLDQAPAAGTLVSPSKCCLFSGGAMGSEAYFGKTAERWGIQEVNFTFEGHNQKRTHGRSLLTDRELAAGAVSLVYVSRTLQRHWDRTPLLRKVLQVLWHVVSHADQVFVVGTIQEDNTVHGGTGWSVELARRWHKSVWVFDQTREGWFYWDGDEWTAGTPVISSSNFAGSGTRFLNEAGQKAIEDLFERSFKNA